VRKISGLKILRGLKDTKSRSLRDDKKKGNGESKTTKAKGCAKSAAFSNVYISILVN
jgi:hypothetical protein